MSHELSRHPLVAPFWKTAGEKMSKTDSMTEDDFAYTIRLDDGAVELTEERVSYYDSSSTPAGALRGTWEAIRVTPWKVILKLTGVDRKGAPSEMGLILTGDDIQFGDLAWVLKHHMGQPFVVEAADATAHGLPPIRLAVDLQHLGLMPVPFPAPGTYFALSGPPGGPLFFSALPLPPSLEPWVRGLYAKDPFFELGPAETLEFRGKPCPAQLCYIASQHAASTVCAMGVPDAGIAFVFGHGGRTVKSCREIATHRSLAQVLERIEIGSC